MNEYQPFHGNDEFVTLSDEEIDFCARFGMEMRKISVANGHRNKHGYDPNEKMAMKIQALGAVCEGAVCRALGRPVQLKQQVFGVADLDGNLQVRLIGRDYYGLRVYPRDEPDWKVVGVIIPPGAERKPYRLPGWIYVREARGHPEWSMDPHDRGHPMIAVPQRFLRPMSELREVLAHEQHS